MDNKNDFERIALEKDKWEKDFRLDRSAKIRGEPCDLDIEIKPVYTPDDISHIDYLKDIGFPGAYPYTRGAYPEMSRHKPWRWAIFAGLGCAEDTKERWKLLYDQGQRNYNLAPDMPTHLGLDSDDPKAEESYFTARASAQVRFEHPCPPRVAVLLPRWQPRSAQEAL